MGRYVCLSSSTTLSESPMAGVSRERGATAVEFAFIALLFFGLIGVIFDLGLGIWRYSLLTYVTSTVTREAAANLTPVGSFSVGGTTLEASGLTCSNFSSPSFDCASLRACIEKYANEYAKTFLGADSTLAFAATFRASSTELLVKGSVTVRCFFCGLFPKPIQVSTSSLAIIENPAFGSFACAS